MESNQQRLLYRLVGSSEGRNRPEKTLFEEENGALSPRQCTVSQVNKTAAKMVEWGFELLPHPSYFPDLAPSDYWLFEELKDAPWKEIWLR